MARLTNDMRKSMIRQIMAGLPNINYVEQIKELAQAAIIENAPKDVRDMYSNEETRKYLREDYVSIRDTSASETVLFGQFYGITDEVRIRYDDRVENLYQEDKIQGILYKRLKESGLIEKHRQQQSLRKSVSERLKSNLDAASTTGRLREILEPELHKFIPPDDPKTPNLPAVVAPVVDDLKKLGFGA